MYADRREIEKWFKPDTIEKVREEIITLVKDYNEAMKAPDLMWTSSYSSLRKLHIRNMFLIGLIQIVSRVETLSRE